MAYYVLNAVKTFFSIRVWPIWKLRPVSWSLVFYPVCDEIFSCFLFLVSSHNPHEHIIWRNIYPWAILNRDLVCRTLLQFSKKKRKRTTSEGSEPDTMLQTPPSPTEEESGTYTYIYGNIKVISNKGKLSMEICSWQILIETDKLRNLGYQIIWNSQIIIK